MTTQEQIAELIERHNKRTYRGAPSSQWHDIAMLLEERDQLKAQIEEMRVAMWPTINFYLRSKIKELEDSRIVAWWSKYLLAGDLHKIVNVYKKYFGRGPTS